MEAVQQEQLVYAALSGIRLVGLGTDLGSLLQRVCEEDWSSEDVAIWQENAAGSSCLVAIVRNGSGRPNVTLFRALYQRPSASAETA